MPARTLEEERDRNAEVWSSKPLLRDVYRLMYDRLGQWIDDSIAGQLVEIGGGIGNFGQFAPNAVVTDQLFAPWLDVCCDAYRLPFQERSVSHLVLFDVFHHLSSPPAFLAEALRVTTERGRVIVLDPYVSAASAVAYGCFHDEPIAWGAPLEQVPSGGDYAAQGNATRFLFRDSSWLRGWRIVHREAFSAFAYLLSGGFSRPAFYPHRWLGLLTQLDRSLSRLPGIFGARCLVVLEREH